MSQHCSFCQKSRKEVKHLITGSDECDTVCYICNECVKLSYEVLNESLKEPEHNKESMTPEQIKEYLDTYVIGQDKAKEALSVAVYNHFKRINNTGGDVEIEKSNIMMMGPSGCGKTLIVKTIAKLLNIPFAIADSTSITAAGYVGQDVESIFERLLMDAKGDVKLAQKGIVFIDEIDKKTRKSSANGTDVGGEAVQQRLLKLIEGDTVCINADPRDKSCQQTVDMDTKDILFIVGGAFIGLEDIVKKRIATGSSIGFGTSRLKDSAAEYLEQAEAEDLHQYGFIREFMGRFPVQVVFHMLDADLLVRVLKEPKNNLLSQYKTLFSIDGVALEFDESYIRSIADQSIKKGTGARGLRSIIEKSLSPVQYVLPRLSKEGLKTVVIGKTGAPEYIYGTAN